MTFICSGTLSLAVACSGGSSAAPVPAPAPAPAPAVAEPTKAEPPAPAIIPALRPALPPQLARLAGLMPLRSLNIEAFRTTHPSYDGRGVLIAVLDGGIDPGLAGMRRTTTGVEKLIDLRDFSGEGRISLSEVRPGADGVVQVEGHTVTGFGRLARFGQPPYYGGVFREEQLGALPAADINGNGSATDSFPVLVARATDGWVILTDTDGNGSLEDERPVHDYAVGAETFTFGTAPMSVAVNAADSVGQPIVDFFFDNSSHGSHVAGIAAGHDLFGIKGFDGVAPGAQVLGIKIANNARGKISVTGSMIRALEYAAAFAARRHLPVVVNLSYGVGNETEGAATIDSLLNDFAIRHPGIPVVVSAGNDGPGISSIDFPASADLALTVCALVPGVFARVPEPGVPAAPDVLGWWSARGGELAKPDLCAPGIAFSNVPPWRAGEEIAGGTSQAAPQIAGTVALLQSAMVQEGRPVRAVDLKQALMTSATLLEGATRLDQGAGVPDAEMAYQWLRASHQTGVYVVRALSEGGNTSSASAAYRRTGLASAADTVQSFRISTIGGQSAARLLLRADVPWLHAPSQIELRGEPVTVAVTYDATKLREPGLHVGTVWARPATDTLVGTAFGLTNTIVTPYPLDGPFAERRSLKPGALHRYYFAVPPDAGGLGLHLDITAGKAATLYVFEPSGRPYRGGGTAEGVSGDSSATVTVTGNDVLPGVYEAVVVAPPASGVTYRVRAALPRVVIRSIGAGPSVSVLNPGDDTVRVTLAAQLTGIAQAYRVTRSDGSPTSLDVPPPSGAGRLILDVSLPDGMWNRVTDFGITVHDGRGRILSDHPLEYAEGRQTVALDSLTEGPLRIELAPAFARALPHPQWEALVRAAFLWNDPRSLTPLDGSSPAALTIAPRESTGVQLAPLLADLELPPNFHPLIEVRVEYPDTPPAIRQEALPYP